MQVHTGIIRRYGQSFLREHLEVYNLKPLDSVIMHVLRKNGQCNQEALCCIVDIDKGRMARIMERLEDRSFIRRVINPIDKREKLVELTEDGLVMLDSIDDIFSEWNELCFAGFKEEERREYQGYLERIAKNAIAWKERLKDD